VFYPQALLQRIRQPAADDAQAREVRKRLTDAAAPWLAMSEDELWSLVFGPAMTRSWMVWSDGYCPACFAPVKMYAWEIDPFGQPWKVRCPACDELFPKNDFAAFHQSGLDEGGLFDPGRADPRLLHNLEHPTSGHPLHRFGVDDGEGFVRLGERWRFVGAYLVYGRWKGQIVEGICRLAQAYSATGEAEYARRAGILLDRVSDVYPDFDYAIQGEVYETRGNRGYASTWHDACAEIQEITLAYDQVREALAEDAELAHFLTRKADEWQLPTDKSSGAQICRNIEARILRETLDHRDKIESNYPTTDMALIFIRTVLDWPANREKVYELFGGVLERACAVDGLSGEKGLTGYSATAPRTLSRCLGLFARADEGFLGRMVADHPGLRDMYRFHIDTWCEQRYYPHAGDCGGFGRTQEAYAAVPFDQEQADPLVSSAFTFFWQLYEASGDAAFVQLLHQANGGQLDGLPHDLLATDPEGFRDDVRQVIEREGCLREMGSINKEAWHLAILRGRSKGSPQVWIDYDSGEPSGLYDHRMDPKTRVRGGHSHTDGMNLGLYYRGLDLMPDFGYPPVSFGGWRSPRAEWYKMTAAHNTVVVDGVDHVTGGATTTLWMDGSWVRGIRVSGPEMVEGVQFERTVVVVDVEGDSSYLLDVFRVIGGSDHTRFTHSHFAELSSSGLSLQPAPDFGYDTQLRGFREDPAPDPGWWVDWQIDDRYGLATPGADVHLRSTELTRQCRAATCEAWVMQGYYGDGKEAWIPCLAARRQAARGPLQSTFVALVEPYDGEARIAGARRLDLHTRDGRAYPDAQVGVAVELADGRRDVIIASDVEDPLGCEPSPRNGDPLVATAPGIEVVGELAVVRHDPEGKVSRVAAANAERLKAGASTFRLGGRGLTELDDDGD